MTAHGPFDQGICLISPVHWLYNYSINHKENQLTISHAIASDTGTYTCLAKNAYGETQHAIKVKVVTLPTVRKEILVKDGATLELPCIGTRYLKGISHVWKKDGRVVKVDAMQSDFKKGSLILKDMDESKVGFYSCHIIKDDRSRVLQTWVKMKPKLILTEGGMKDAMEDDPITFACNVLTSDDIDAKRLWKYNDTFLDSDSQRKISKNNGKLLEIQQLKLSDSGNYSCIASSSSAGDGKSQTITFKLNVLPKPKKLKGCETGIDDITVSKVEEVEERGKRLHQSAIVSWNVPSDLNHSCYDSINLIWWTNDSDRYFEKSFALDTNQAIIGDLNPQTGHYVQVNLVTPQRTLILGSTQSFVISKLEKLGVPPALGINESFYNSALTIILVAVLVSSLFLVMIAIVIYRNKKKHHRHGNSSSFGHLVCCDNCCISLCRKFTKSSDDQFVGKTNFNGFDRNAYHAAIIPLDVGGSGGFTSSNHSDFMANLTPQWPEPEDPIQTSASEDQEEHDPFLTRCSTFTPSISSDVKQVNNTSTKSSSNHKSSNGRSGGGEQAMIGLRRHSKTSISSSWSSLFNVPTSNTSTIKTTPSPNRKSIANTESTFTPRKRL